MFQVMLPRSARVLAASLTAIIVSLAAPALAIAHGHAHEHLLEHSRGPGDLAASMEGVAVASEAEHQGHSHPVLDQASLTRLNPLVPAPPTAEVVAAEEWSQRDGQSLPPVPFESPPGRVFARPQQPRAPPAI